MERNETKCPVIFTCRKQKKLQLDAGTGASQDGFFTPLRPLRRARRSCRIQEGPVVGVLRGAVPLLLQLHRQSPAKIVLQRLNRCCRPRARPLWQCQARFQRFHLLPGPRSHSCSHNYLFVGGSMFNALIELSRCLNSFVAYDI